MLKRQAAAESCRAGKPGRAAGIAAARPHANPAVAEAAARAPDEDGNAAQALSQDSAGIVLVSDDDEEVVMRAAEAADADAQQAPGISGLPDACGPVEDTQVQLERGLTGQPVQ